MSTASVIDFPLVHCGAGTVPATGFADRAGWSDPALRPYGEASPSALVPTIVPSIRNPAVGNAALRLPLKCEALARWTRVPRLRRASPLTLFMREAVEQARLGSAITFPAPERLGLIGCFWTGTMIYSRRFYQEILTSGPRFASPNLFPETVFNVALSHIAAELGVGGAVYALIGDEGSIATALKTARVWLQSDLVDEVVIIGAEEIDAVSLEAYADLGWIVPFDIATGQNIPGRKREGTPPPRLLPAEGAVALRVRSRDGYLQGVEASSISGEEKQRMRTRYCTIEAVEDGYTYHRPDEALAAAQAALGPSIAANIEIFYGFAQNTWLREIEARAVPERLRCPVDPARSNMTTDHFDPPGYAFTASALWQLRLVPYAMRRDMLDRITVPLWGHNTQISTLQLCPQQHKNPYGPRGTE